MQLSSNFVTNSGNSFHSSIANGTTVGFPANSGYNTLQNIIGEATANATYNLGQYDGVTMRIGLTGGSGAAVMAILPIVLGCQAAISNSGTVGGFYSICNIQFLI